MKNSDAAAILECLKYEHEMTRAAWGEPDSAYRDFSEKQICRALDMAIKALNNNGKK